MAEAGDAAMSGMSWPREQGQEEYSGLSLLNLEAIDLGVSW
jgi:hypothetical protein